MRITNNFNLPEAFVRFDQKNRHNKGDADFSVTEVIDSSRISKLRKRHYEDIEEDISDRIMSILGTATHTILEQGAPPDAIVEERLSATFYGTTISGQIDLQTPVGEGQDEGIIISDYKTCRAFAIQASAEGKPEWESQLNLYGLLAEANGRKVKGREVVAIIRDWNAAQAKRADEYPKHAVVRIPITMWAPEKAEKYLADRINAHTSPDLSQCTIEERWERPTQYAVHEPTLSGPMRKRATRLFDNLIDAHAFIHDKCRNGEVQVRPGEAVRCKSYCPVSEHCDQYQSTLQEKGNE